MNIRFVLYLVGNLLMFVSPLPGVCAAVAASDAIGHPGVVNGFLGSGLAMLLTGAAFHFGFRASKTDTLLRREVIGTVSFSWIFVCVLGAIPFYFLGERPSGALFESVSGFTTTGSTVFTDIEALPKSILLWRSLTQWVGGLGILVFLVALLSRLGIRGKALMGAESSVNIGASSTSKVKDLALRLLYLYLFITGLCFVCLLVTGQFTEVRVSAFEALLYSFSTVSTGGFAPHNDSVAHYDSFAIEMVLAVFMLVCSISFVLLYSLFFVRDGRANPGADEAKYFLLLFSLVVIGVTVALVLKGHFPIAEAFRKACFPVASMISSTGFGTDDYDTWPVMGKLMIALVMVIGGCSGSTAGGIKVYRFMLLVMVLKFELEKTYRPRLVYSIRLDGRRVDSGFQYSAMIYLAAVAFLLILSTGIVSLLEPGIDCFETAFGAILGTFFNMGPGFGDVGPTDNFGHLHSYTLLFLSWIMLLGRLEIFVLASLFSVSFWRVK